VGDDTAYDGDDDAGVDLHAVGAQLMVH